MHKPHCKRCAVDYVRQSRRLGALARVLSTMHMYPFRCQICAHRFWVVQWGKADRRAEFANDKRDFQRLVVQLPVSFVGDQKTGEGLITNLSVQGCLLETETRPHHGAILSLTLYPSDSLPPIDVEAAVVRSALGRRLGLEFLEIDPSEEQRLRGYIESLIATHPNELKKIFLNA